MVVSQTIIECQFMIIPQQGNILPAKSGIEQHSGR